MAIKDYCIGCYWKYNDECIKPRGEYCPASSIKAERRKAKEKEEVMKERKKPTQSWVEKAREEIEFLYKGLDRYEEFLGLVACMRVAQKEANDLIAQVECYEEAMEHIKKAEELEQIVDKWLEGEAL